MQLRFFKLPKKTKIKQMPMTKKNPKKLLPNTCILTTSLFSAGLWSNSYSKATGENTATLSEVRKSNVVLQNLPKKHRNQTTRNSHKQMVVDFKSHQNKLGDHKLQNCADAGIKFSRDNY